MVAFESPLPRSAPALPRDRAARTANGRLAWPVKLYFLAVLLPILFSLGPLNLSPLRLVALCMTVPLLGMLLAGRFGRLVITDYFFLAYLAWMLLSLLVKNPDRAVENFGSVGAEFLGGYLIGRAFIQNRAQFISLCKFLAIITACLLPIAVFETLTARPIVLEVIRNLPGVSSPIIAPRDERLGLDRVQGIFVHPIHFGLFCSIAFSLTFVGLKDNLPNRARVGLSLIVGLCTFLGLSSGALLALALQLFLISWFMIFRKLEKRWWLLVGLCVLAYVTIDLLSNRTPIRVFMSYATFSAHNAFWRAIIFEWGIMNVFGSVENNIPASPWFGIGLNDWERPIFMQSSSVDNFWLLTLMRHGLPGLVFLVIGYLGGLLGILRRDFTGDTVLLNLRRGWIFTFLGLSFCLATVHIWSTVYSFVFFMFGAGLWMLNTSVEQDDAPAETEDVPSDTSERRYSRFAPKTRETAPAIPSTYSRPQSSRSL